MGGVKKRGNGTGSVYRENGTWTAEKTLGYDDKPDGTKKRIMSRKKGFRTKTEALEYLKTMTEQRKKTKSIPFREICQTTIDYHVQRGISHSTVNCYRAAEKYFYPVSRLVLDEITVDDLQRCISECPHGKRTQQNMRTLCGLVYKYAMSRGLYSGNNLAQYIYITGDEGEEKQPFSHDELRQIGAAVGRVPYAGHIYAACYLGFRPSELLALTVNNYDEREHTLTGGSKTDAGRDRVVTISPKIQPIIDRLIATSRDGHIFHKNGFKMGIKAYRSLFYAALEQIGIDNNTAKRTPHSCRHTFADLLKSVNAPDKDKLRLIGHASEEMLRYYQSSGIEDLRRITDVL